MAAALRTRLRGNPCRFYGSDLKFQVAEGHVRYPDGMVVCSPVDRTATVVHDPIVVFEVLSPSTARDDRIVKAREYQATPSVQRYIMLEQDSVSATVYARSGEMWTHDILVANSILALPEIGIDLPLAELYEGIVFEAQDHDRRASEILSPLDLSSRRGPREFRSWIYPVVRPLRVVPVLSPRGHRQSVINRRFHEPCSAETHDARRIPRVGENGSPCDTNSTAPAPSP